MVVNSMTINDIKQIALLINLSLNSLRND